MNKIALIGVKVGMADMEIFNEKVSCFVRTPVTLIKVLPCHLVGQVAYENVFSLRIAGGKQVSKKKVSKPEIGSHFKNTGDVFFDTVKEFRFDRKFEIEPNISFEIGEYLIGREVNVRGKTIGKGFQGVMKRHNFAGLNASHGVSLAHRSHGGTGLGRSWGSGVGKGKRMAGHMGSVNITQKNLQIVNIDKNENIIHVKGSVPGFDSSVLLLTDNLTSHSMISHINNIPVKDLGNVKVNCGSIS